MEFKRGLFPLLLFAFSEILVATEVGRGARFRRGLHLGANFSCQLRQRAVTTPIAIPHGSDHHILVNRTLCRNTGNKNLQIKRNDHMLNHQTNDVLITEKRKKKIDQIVTQHCSISRLLQPHV